MAIDKGHLQHVYNEENKLSLQVCQIASGEIKISLKKREKNQNTNRGSSCKSFNGFSEVAKNGSHAFKLLERILWVRESLLSAPRHYET